MAPRMAKSLNKKAAALAKLKLPKLSLGVGLTDPQEALNNARIEPFAVQTLAAAIQNCETDDVLQYLHHYAKHQTKQKLQTFLVENEYPILCFAVAQNNEKVLRALLSFSPRGEMTNARTKSGIPTLAFAVLYGMLKAVDTLNVFKVLLANGADPECIPKDMWDFDSILKRPQSRQSKKFETTAASIWCDLTFRDLLAQSLNVSQKYFLWQASLQQAPAKYEQQGLFEHNMRGLLELPYHLVGQQSSVKLLKDHVLSHILIQREQPLVILFAGPSGHGKTELAERLGVLLGNVQPAIIDCAQMNTAAEVLGPSLGYKDSEKGSRLNNHLATYSGKRSIVFLDEFEKMGSEARLSLLQILDKGTYHDHKNNAYVDTKQTIFILATNSCSDTIQEWYESNMKEKTGAERANAKLEDLAREIRQKLIGLWEAETVGRCDLIIPFLPFNEVERAIIAHAFILKLRAYLREPINIQRKHLIGHIDLAVLQHEHVVTLLGNAGYLSAQGARTIEKSVTSQIQNMVVDVWRKHDTNIDEGVNEGPLAKYIVKVVPGTAGQDAIDVFEDGTANVYD